MNYRSGIATLKGISNREFREARKEFLEDRPAYYLMIDGLYKEGLLDEAKKREAELAENEKRFGVAHDYSLGNVGIVRVDVTKYKLTEQTN